MNTILLLPSFPHQQGNKDHQLCVEAVMLILWAIDRRILKIPERCLTKEERFTAFFFLVQVYRNWRSLLYVKAVGAIVMFRWSGRRGLVLCRVLNRRLDFAIESGTWSSARDGIRKSTGCCHVSCRSSCTLQGHAGAPQDNVLRSALLCNLCMGLYFINRVIVII